jgi:hypothetical protein
MLRLTPAGRLRLVQRCCYRPIAHVAAEAGVSRQCLSKWVGRYRHDCEVGLDDRSLAPSRRPTTTAIRMRHEGPGLIQQRWRHCGFLPIHHEAERLPFPSSGARLVQRAESAPPCVAEEKRMYPVEGPPAIVRWTLRLEDATALDTAVQAVEPTIRSVFGTGARAAGVAW